MDKVYNVALVGNGSVASWGHIPTWKALRDEGKVKIVALCDIKTEQGEKFAKEFGLEDINRYTDYYEMIEKEDIDIVDICTPNKFHSEYAIDALNRGKDVFCEKPDAMTVADVQKMEEAYKKSGKTLMIMRNNRFDRNTMYLKKYIEDGKMGDIYAVRCGWQRRRGQPPKGSWFSQKALSGGGPLIDLGVHFIDLSIWLMGFPKAVSVSACTYREIMKDLPEAPFDVEDLSMGFIRFENGACLQFEFSWASNVDGERTFLELRGNKAGAYWTDGELKIFEGDCEGTQYDIVPHTKVPHSHHDACIRHFFDVVTKGEKPIFTPDQGIEIIKILAAIYESAETGKEVRL